MNIELLVQRRRDNRTFNISELASDIEWTTSITNSQPGSLQFGLVEDDNIIPDYGDFVRFRVGNRNVFFGRVFTKERNQGRVMTVIAYDLMKFLKNKHTYVLRAATSSQIFRQICQDFELKHRIVNASNFNVPAKMHDNETLYNIMQDAFDTTLINRREWFFVRDNFGTLEHININSLQTSLVVGDESMATDYDFKGSIADDTFNQVRLVRENQETMRREVYIVRDSANINRWGRLQFHDTVDDNLNAAQIEARASMILRAKNRPTRELSITALGDLRIRAGNGIVLSIRRLRNEGFASVQRALVCGCTHHWTNGTHVMDLTLRVVN